MILLAMKLQYVLLVCCFITAAVSTSVNALEHQNLGNTKIQSFNKAKKILEKEVVSDRRVTLYCNAEFDENKEVIIPRGFESASHQKRKNKIEWEHVVPAENFGRAFSEWRNGSPDCVDSKGRSFKGRKCAEKTNVLFRYMQSDLYNLYPAIGSVNAERGNKNFSIFPKNTPSNFGSCQVKVKDNKVEPPEQARGAIARTYKYMERAYPLFRLSSEQKKIMETWDKQYPVQKWECIRAKRIEKIQGNENLFVKEPCQAAGMW